MWQEARKQEKILRGIMVDHKRRAEKRKGFYDKIRKDPTEFLQVWGKSIKINVDSTAENNPSIMTNWHGDLIDRFDVRSHLDEYKEPLLNETDLNENEKSEEKMLNFERYKTLIQNEALGVTEKQLLKQIELDEKFGSLQSHQVKKKQETKAQIGYNYEDSSKNISHVSTLNKPVEPDLIDENEEDLDLALDSKKLTSDDKLILNKCALNYGLEFGDFMKILIKEEEEKETIKKNKLLEEEKAQYSGRKSRRERRIVKDRLRKERGEISELSYIVNEDSTDTETDTSRSRSNSKSSNSSRSKTKRNKFEKVPTCEPLQNQVTYITSFGVQNDAVNNHCDEIDNNLAQDLDLKINKSFKQDNYSLNVKRLRQDATESSPRSRRTASKSPSNETKKLVTDSSSSSDSTSDEEKALEKYLQRRDNRKQINSQGKSFSLVSSSDCTLINKESKISTQNTSSNFNVISSNQNNNSISAKSTSSGDFKLYQEKLKKKMSKQINKQLKKDKEVEREKGKKERENRREREKELNYLAEKIRLRKALERKKNMDSSDSDRSSGTPKNSRPLYIKRNITNSRSRSRKTSRSRSRSRRISTSRRSSRSRSRRISKSTSSSRSRRNSRSRSQRRSRSRRNSRSRSRSRKISRNRSRSSSRTRSFSNRNLNSRENSERKNIFSRR